MRRLEGNSRTPYYFAFIVGVAPLIWMFIYNSPLDVPQQIMYATVIVLGCGLGAFFGHKAGLKSQILFRQKLEEYIRNTGQLTGRESFPEENSNKN